MCSADQKSNRFDATKMPTVTPLARYAQLAMLLSSFASAQTESCHASVAAFVVACRFPESCPAEVDENAIEVGDKVTFEACMVNWSTLNNLVTGVEAFIPAGSVIGVVLGCRQTSYSDWVRGPRTPEATCSAGQWPEAFRFVDFQRPDVPDVSFTTSTAEVGADDSRDARIAMHGLDRRGTTAA